jgi:hypothetical protein
MSSICSARRPGALSSRKSSLRRSPISTCPGTCRTVAHSRRRRWSCDSWRHTISSNSKRSNSITIKCSSSETGESRAHHKSPSFACHVLSNSVKRHDLLLSDIPHQELASEDTLSLELALDSSQTEALFDTFMKPNSILSRVTAAFGKDADIVFGMVALNMDLAAGSRGKVAGSRGRQR